MGKLGADGEFKGWALTATNRLTAKICKDVLLLSKAMYNTLLLSIPARVAMLQCFYPNLHLGSATTPVQTKTLDPSA